MFSSNSTSACLASSGRFSAASNVSSRTTESPSAALSAGKTCPRLRSRLTLPLGLPKCANKIGLPPLARISLTVGTIRSIRVVSVTLPFSIGTLMSTRSSTRLPLKSMSSSVFQPIFPFLLPLVTQCFAFLGQMVNALAWQLGGSALGKGQIE